MFDAELEPYSCDLEALVRKQLTPYTVNLEYGGLTAYP